MFQVGHAGLSVDPWLELGTRPRSAQRLLVVLHSDKKARGVTRSQTVNETDYVSQSARETVCEWMQKGGGLERGPFDSFLRFVFFWFG